MNISCGHIARAAACLMAAAVAGPSPAAAFGAVALGEPASIAKQGVAIGLSRNYSSKEGAEARALKECLSFVDAPPDTRALCKIIRTFEKQCYAVAIDPQAGTPGFGWSIMPTKAEAESSAMNRCRETAGASRVKFCKVATSDCDSAENPPP